MLISDMAKGTTIVVLFALAVLGQALTPSTFFTNVDKERLRSVFQSAKPYGDDLQSLYYSVMGFGLLRGSFEEPAKICDAIKKNVKTDDLESVFFSSSAAATIKASHKCDFPKGSAEATLTAAIAKEGASTEQIFQAVSSLKNLNLKVDNAKVSAALNDALKADDTPLSHGFAFYAASFLGADANKFFDLIEDIIAQADEVDEKYLQFEGGRYVTAIVIDSAYKLAGAVKKAPTMSEDKVIKFANYFLSRKHVTQLKNAAATLAVVKTLTDNQFHIPIAVTLASQVSVSDKYPVVQVRVSDLLGKSLGKVTVTADTARHLGDDAVVLSKKPFSASSVDDSLYELDFLKVKPIRGFYKISVSVAPQKKDARLIGTSGAEVEVKVTTQVSIDNVEIGVSDKEQSTAPKTAKLQHPNKAANALQADHHQKISMKFQLRDKAFDKVMTVHQAFVRFINTKTKQEVIFVAESDSSQVYKFELDVGASAKDFAYQSGKYTMDLIVGDAVIQNPFSWTVADAALTFPEAPKTSADTSNRYQKKPEINHVFRTPEPRPPAAISSLFTALVLLPVLILLALWMRIGVNISNFPFSVSAMGFHIGLALVFGLYYMYWTQLNMFDTLRYLGILAVPTFFFGNRLLSSIAARRK